jgi:hypothetical protein
MLRSALCTRTIARKAEEQEKWWFFDTACPDVHDTHLWGILSHLFSAKINTKMIKKRSTKACRRAMKHPIDAFLRSFRPISVNISMIDDGEAQS